MTILPERLLRRAYIFVLAGGMIGFVGRLISKRANKWE